MLGKLKFCYRSLLLGNMLLLHVDIWLIEIRLSSELHCYIVENLHWHHFEMRQSQREPNIKTINAYPLLFKSVICKNLDLRKVLFVICGSPFWEALLSLWQ